MIDLCRLRFARTSLESSAPPTRLLTSSGRMATPRIFYMLLLTSLIISSQALPNLPDSPVSYTQEYYGRSTPPNLVVSPPADHVSSAEYHGELLSKNTGDSLYSPSSDSIHAATESPHGQDAGHDAGGAHEEHHGMHISTVDFARVEVPFIIALWILSASLAKIGFHMAPKLSSIFPESCLLIVVGIVIGLLLFHTNSIAVSPLTPETFFFYLLPPIILDAGYFMPNRLFFDHLGTILLFAVMGTIWNTITIGLALWGCGLTGVYGFDLPLLDTFLFSALISAVDPVAVLAVFEEIHVNEVLYIVVFGESLLNDAVTVVLYNMFDTYVAMTGSNGGDSSIPVEDIIKGIVSFFVVALGGTAIGILWGFLTAFVTRFTNHVRVIEPIFIFVMSYLAYLNAEVFHMSGILAITFCGITMKNYVESNISQKSHTVVKYAMKMLSSSSETIIFMFLGVSTIHDNHEWNTAFILLTIFFCSLFRAIGVIILTEIANHFRLHKLDHVEKFVMSYGGLRGAVAFALVMLVNPKVVKKQPLFVTATIAMIYFTVFFQGITIKPLVKILKVKRSQPRDKTMNERIHERFMDHMMAGFEDILGHLGNFRIRDKFKHFDHRFIRPCLVREHKAFEPKILETYSKLTMKDAMDMMRRNATFSTTTNSESMAVLFRNYTAQNLGLHGSSSFSQMDNMNWNLDIGELEYSPSARDLTDAKIHHLLSEELNKPYRRSHRRLSYSRHAVNDKDLSTTNLNHNMHMHIRRMVSETVRKQHSKRLKKNKDGHGANGSIGRNGKNVSFEILQENGSAKKLHDDYLHSVIKEVSEAEEGGGKVNLSSSVGDSHEDLEGGITFTAGKQFVSDARKSALPSRPALPSPGAPVSTGLMHVLATSAVPTGLTTIPESLPVPKPSNVKKFRSKSTSQAPDLKDGVINPAFCPDNWTLKKPTIEDTPVVCATNKSPRMLENHIMLPPPVDPSRDESEEEGVKPTLIITPTSAFDLGEDIHPSTPTATEVQFPWKRMDDDNASVPQREFPTWVVNKEYTTYNSPTSTFLGGLEKRTPHPSVIGLFKRESVLSRLAANEESQFPSIPEESQKDREKESSVPPASPSSRSDALN